MIIDSHTYCFKSVNNSNDYRNKSEHLAWIQQANAQHHQPAIKISDRSHQENNGLSSKKNKFSNLPKVNFRIDNKTGRVLWDFNNETFTKYYYPPNLINLEFSAYSLISEMDYAGIDIAILHTNPSLGKSNEFQSECIKLFPDRLLSMASVDEWLIENQTEQIIEKTIHSIKNLKLNAIKFNPLCYLESNTPWDSGNFIHFWDEITKLGVPIFFTLGTGPNFDSQNKSSQNSLKGYFNELKILINWMHKYPNIKCTITHGFPWRLLMNQSKIELPKELWEPFQNPLLNMEVCFPVRIGDIIDYPYKEIWPTLTELINKIGSERLHFGTDMPFQNRFCTYSQSKKWIEYNYKNFTGMSKYDLEMIMGGTAKKLLDIKS